VRVTLSYEEQLINALSRVTHKRGEDVITRDKRTFDAMRAVLTPLYRELDTLRAQLAAMTAERDRAMERLAEATAITGCVLAALEGHDKPRPDDPFPACGLAFPISRHRMRAWLDDNKETETK
jgi:hypothetical protein